MPPHRALAHTRPKTTLGFAGRSALLAMWDRMDADQQDQLLLAAEAILARDGEQIVVPAVKMPRR